MPGDSVRRIAVFSSGRQDYGILRSTLLQLQADPRFELLTWIGGMHVHDTFGRPEDELRQDGLIVHRRFAFVSDPPEPLADSARALGLLGAALAADAPHALLVVGDRTETVAAGLAATIAKVPVAHMHGGEETEGAIDNVLRHALTKLSHLHFVAHEDYAARVRQMGEAPSSIVVVGVAGADNVFRNDLPSRADLETSLGIDLKDPIVIVTLHPTTLGGAPDVEVRELAAALEGCDATWIVTQPNADEGAETIRAFWRRWVSRRRNAVVVDALGTRRYWGLLKLSTALVGNSSSGILEGPALGLPVVNIGDRQRGRRRGAGVIDVAADAEAIRLAISRALRTPKRVAEGTVTHGPVAHRIVEALALWRPPVPPRKPFCDLRSSTPTLGNRERGCE